MLLLEPNIILMYEGGERGYFIKKLAIFSKFFVTNFIRFLFGFVVF